MMKVTVYNLDKKEVGTIDVPDKIFGTKWSPDLVHQALVVQGANSRNIVAHTKNRGEVRGGGKKPWKQKGTGRARHGSIRSPLWRGGGVTFGPRKERIFERKINKKMRFIAVLSVLSNKFASKNITVVDGFSSAAKTKEFSNSIKNILTPKTNTTFIFSDKNKGLNKAARNIPKVETISPKSLNVYDLLWPKNIVIEKEAIAEIAGHYKNLK
jgi:large subunit ribosomal protein L4